MYQIFTMTPLRASHYVKYRDKMVSEAILFAFMRFFDRLEELDFNDLCDAVDVFWHRRDKEI